MGFPLVSQYLHDASAPCLSKTDEVVVVKNLGLYRSLAFKRALEIPGACSYVCNKLASLDEAALAGWVDLGKVNRPDFISCLKRSAQYDNQHESFCNLWESVIPTYRLRQDVIMFAYDVACQLVDLSHELSHHDYLGHRKIYPFMGAYKKYKCIFDSLVYRNLPLVSHLCGKRKLSGSLEYSDLYQEGCKGLIKAVERFDVNANNRFYTYAFYWIRACIDLAIKNKERTVRIPVHTAVKINKINRARQKLFQQTGRTPSNSELSAGTGIDTTKLADLGAIAGQVVSVDDDCGPELSGSMFPDSYVENAHLQKTVLDELRAVLPDKKLEIMVKRFGLNGAPAMAFRDIATSLESTEFSVRAAYYDSLKKLKNHRSLARLFGEL